MSKRVLRILFTALVLCALFSPAQGAEQSEADRICEQIVSIHNRSLAATGKESLGGFCGLEVSWELYLLGINSSLQTYNGNDHYDAYSVLDRTTGGYRVKAYPAEDYSMQEALEEICQGGTRDVYNIMVGFQRTSTEAGQIFGHVCMIHAILDGKVYFVEGFATSFGTQEGQPIIVTIPEFVAYWDHWTQYEGLVYFGQKDPIQDCPCVETELYIQTVQELPLEDRPLSEDRTVLRTVPAGERLLAKAIYETENGYYYEIEEDGTYAYLAAKDTIPLIYGAGDATFEEPELPSKLEVGERFTLKGKILSPDDLIDGIQIRILDESGESVQTFEQSDPGEKFDLNRYAVQKSIDFSKLTEGCYTYEINALFQRSRISHGQILQETYTYALAEGSFSVGNAIETKMKACLADNGWAFQNGKWLLYEKGTLHTGWYSENGIQYYFTPDGTAATGWTDVDGQQYYFSGTGAMRTGWLTADAGTVYLQADGAKAVGWKEIEDTRYFFNDSGFLIQQGWIKEEDRLYYLLEGGEMAVGWVDLPQGRFSFHADGHLMALLVDGKTVPYDGQWQPEEIQ